MTIFLMCLAGVLLAMSLTVVIFSTTSNNNQVKDLGESSLRWAVVWMMLFMTMFYIHTLQEELNTHLEQEHYSGEN